MMPESFYDLAAGVATFLLSAGCAAHALINKRDPRAATGWIALCLLVPLLGPLAYVLLGINRAHRQASDRRREAQGRPSSRFQNLGEEPVRAQPPPSPGNDVAAFADGPAAFDAMLADIGDAKRRVWLCQYIFESRGIGANFIKALSDAVGRGVEVCVLVDRVGALYSAGNTVRRLQAAGVTAATFLPVRLWPPALRLNLRNHRKILVVDERVAYVGGMNIRNGYLPAGAGSEPAIRDTQFAIHGPLVSDLAAVFQDDWFMATGATLAFPETGLAAAGSSLGRLTVDGPDNRSDLITVSLLGAIAAASKSVRLMTPYFLPPGELVSALQTAAVRGIDVLIVLPATNNLVFVHWAMQHGLPALLRYGVKIFFQTGSFDHSKILTIDDRVAVIGSFNIDPRSLRLNYELGVEIWDPTLTRELNTQIDARAASASPVSLAGWRRVPLWRRLRNALAWLASPYL